MERLKNESLYGKFKPFRGQVNVHDAVFARNCRVIFLQCGRGWSKTHTAVWLAAKWSLYYNNHYILHLCPLYKQVKKIVWHPKLYEQFLLPEFILNTNNQETYLEIGTGTRIELDGSDNYDAQRGLKPNLVLADEYADFNPEWIDVMFPNVGKSGGTIIFMGTPPEFPKLADGTEHHYVKWMNYVKERMLVEPNKYFHLHLPTSNNPFYPKEFLADEKKRLTDLNMDYVYQREYEALVVSGSGRQVFTFKKERNVGKHEEIIGRIRENPERYDLWAAADPATKGSKFGVVFMAIDPYTSTPYWLGEIREDSTHLKTVGQIVPRILGTLEELLPGVPQASWNLIADSAAAWFIEEAFANHGVVFSPSEKRVGDKEEGISLLNEIFNTREGIISDECVFTQLEFANCTRDNQGKAIKANDDLIDPSRYVLKAAGFSFVNEPEKVVKKNEDNSPWDNFQEKYHEWKQGRDWTYGLDL